MSESMIDLAANLTAASWLAVGGDEALTEDQAMDVYHRLLDEVAEAAGHVAREEEAAGRGDIAWERAAEAASAAKFPGGGLDFVHHALRGMELPGTQQAAEAAYNAAVEAATVKS